MELEEKFLNKIQNLHPKDSNELLAKQCVEIAEDFADEKLNDYLNALLCTRTIPMPNAHSNSIAESIINFLKHLK